MAKLLGPDCRLFVTETSEDYLKLMKERLTPREFPQITVVRGAETSTHLPDGSCEAVYMRRVFHHFSHSEAMTSAVFQALRPGGRIAVIDFAPSGEREPRDGISPDVIERHLVAAGYKIERPAEPWRSGDYIILATN